jgi:hypothetical protein
MNSMSLFPLQLKAGTWIDAPLNEVERCLLHWGSGHPADRDTRSRRQRTSLTEAINYLEPRFFTPDRALLVAHASGWTGFFNNHSRQFQPQAELFVLSERLRTRTCFFLYETEGEHAGSAVFEHHQYQTPDGVVVRALWLGKEPRWQFIQSGVRLPFERPEVYAAARVRDRLPPELLRDYGAALGIRFWELDGYLDHIAFLGWRSDFPGQRPHGGND